MAMAIRRAALHISSVAMLIRRAALHISSVAMLIRRAALHTSSVAKLILRGSGTDNILGGGPTLHEVVEHDSLISLRGKGGCIG